MKLSMWLVRNCIALKLFGVFEFMSKFWTRSLIKDFKINVMRNSATCLFRIFVLNYLERERLLHVTSVIFYVEYSWASLFEVMHRSLWFYLLYNLSTLKLLLVIMNLQKVLLNLSGFLDMSEARLSLVVGSSKKNNTYIHELMSSDWNDTSSFYKNGMEGEVMRSRPTECLCNLPIK